MVNAVSDAGVANVPHVVSSSGDTYEKIRRNYEQYIHVTFDELGLASREQTQLLKSWLDGLDPSDEEGIKRAAEMYDTIYEKQLDSALELHKEYVDQLYEAKGFISDKSFKEWISWIRDDSRDYKQKEYSIKNELPKYISERKELAKDREELMGDKRIEGVTDSALQSKIDDLTDDKKWFESLEFTERKDLINRIKAGLATESGDEKMKGLKDEAEKVLVAATKEPQPALHRDKVGVWLKRIFDDGVKKLRDGKVSEKDIQEKIRLFIYGQDAKSLGGLIKTWRGVAVQFWRTRADPAFEGVKTEFVNTKGFLWKHYKERVSYVNVMKQQRDRAKSLRGRAWSIITGASEALDAKGRARWLNDYVFNGNHTLEELESIINGNLAVRLDAKMNVYHRYDKAKKKADKLEGLRGMEVPEKGEFLNFHYKKQLVKVAEMEQRIKELEKNSPDFLLIRQSMDRGDWDEAMELIEEGRKKKDVSPGDAAQLDSMEEYVKQHEKYKGDKVEAIEKKGEEAKEIDELIASLPEDLQGILIALAEEGADCVKMFGWGVYNREWCNRHGYLNPEREMNSIRDGKMQALTKMRKQKKKGKVDETIQGETGEAEYIELSRSSATNVCLDTADTGAKSAMIRTVKNRKSDHRAWYWTNIILHRGGNLMSLENQIMENKKIYKIGRLLKKLERKGEHYSFKGMQASMGEKAKIAKS